MILAQRGGERKIEEDLGISLHQFFFPVCFLRVIFLFLSSLLPFITTVFLYVAPEEVLWVHDVMK